MSTFKYYKMLSGQSLEKYTTKHVTPFLVNVECCTNMGTLILNSLEYTLTRYLTEFQRNVSLNKACNVVACGCIAQARHE